LENLVLSWFRKAAEVRRTAKELYGVIVTRALQPGFFAEHGVRDTPEGRLGMVMLHMYLTIDRLMKEGAAGSNLARHLTEAFVVDIDDNLREMGVGDLSVPKKVKSAAGALRHLCASYGAALHKGENALAASLAGSIPGLEDNPARALAIARYTVRAWQSLAELTAGQVLSGKVSLPAFSAGSDPAAST
jgi:cytochrome b pre-mRNA-processing protein 3